MPTSGTMPTTPPAPVPMPATPPTSGAIPAALAPFVTLAFAGMAAGAYFL
jgi:hypothetical protein